MKIFLLSFILTGMVIFLKAQPAVTTNKHFSIGSYGRAGIARGDKVQSLLTIPWHKPAAQNEGNIFGVKTEWCCHANKIHALANRIN